MPYPESGQHWAKQEILDRVIELQDILEDGDDLEIEYFALITEPEASDNEAKVSKLQGDIASLEDALEKDPPYFTLTHLASLLFLFFTLTLPSLSSLSSNSYTLPQKSSRHKYGLRLETRSSFFPRQPTRRHSLASSVSRNVLLRGAWKRSMRVHLRICCFRTRLVLARFLLVAMARMGVVHEWDGHSGAWSERSTLAHGKIEGCFDTIG